MLCISSTALTSEHVYECCAVLSHSFLPMEYGLSMWMNGEDIHTKMLSDIKLDDCPLCATFTSHMLKSVVCKSAACLCFVPYVLVCLWTTAELPFIQTTQMSLTFQ